MSHSRSPRVAVGPDPVPVWLIDAVNDGGGEIVSPAHADAIVWADVADPSGLAAAIDAAPRATWIQPPSPMNRVRSFPARNTRST